LHDALPTSRGIRVDVRGGRGKRAHVHADHEGLFLLQDHVGLLDLHASGADGLHFPALEHEPRRVPLLDEVVVERLLVLDDAHSGGFLHAASMAALALAISTSACLSSSWVSSPVTV